MTVLLRQARVEACRSTVTTLSGSNTRSWR